MTDPTTAARLRALRDHMATLNVPSWHQVAMRDMLVVLADMLLPPVERAELDDELRMWQTVGAESLARTEASLDSGHGSGNPLPVPPIPDAPRVERFGIVPKLDDDPVILTLSRTVAEYEARKLTGYRVVRLVELRESERIVPTENERDPEAHRTIAALRRDLAEAQAELEKEATANDRLHAQLAAERQRGVEGVVDELGINADCPWPVGARVRVTPITDPEETNG